MVLFAPGILVRSGLYVATGRLQGATVRCAVASVGSDFAPYYVRGARVSWARLTRDSIAIQISLGAVLLAPLAVQALGDVSYLVPANVRELRLLLASGDNLALVGGFISRFTDSDFWRFWMGASCLVAVMPPRSTRRLARIDAERNRNLRLGRLVGLLDGLAWVDDKIAPLGFSSYLTSGVIIAFAVVALEIVLLGAAA
jgi:hypothetical protein